MTDITPYFPITDKVKEPRPQQIELFEEITQYFEDGYDKISICAPTGIGKSPLAVSLARYMSGKGKNTLITSPLNELVDQYDRDFGEEYLDTIKGRKHYACNADYTRSCAEGYCQEKTCSLNPGKPRYCMDLTTADLCDKSTRAQCACLNCIYKSKMKAYKNSNRGNTNFTLLLKGVTNKPDLVIIDECDTAEDFIRMQYSITIPEIIDWEDFEDHIVSLEDWKLRFNKVYYELQEAMLKTSNPAHKKQLVKDIERAKRRCMNVSRIINDYNEHGEPWAITNNENKQSTKYEPITTHRFLQPLLNNKFVVQMSATPQGIPGYDYFEVDSPFPVDIRPWTYKPLGPMSLKHRDKTIPKVAEFICKLKGKTLVHCISYDTAEKIGRALQGVCGGIPYVQIGAEREDKYFDGHQTVTRQDAVTKFKRSEDPNQILLSVKMDRGVDFPEPDITNNIIAVMPWPNPVDQITIAKNKLLGEEWKNEVMANTIMQQYGRVNRNTDKITATYILDSNFGIWYKNNKGYFKDWFIEAKV
jgi:ATP-dependent DNA helicase DinG